MPKNRLRELREGRGLSQAQLAAVLSPVADKTAPPDGSTVSLWERGKSDIPDWRKQEIAEYFGVSVPFLMGWDQSKDNGDENGHDVPVVA